MKLNLIKHGLLVWKLQGTRIFGSEVLRYFSQRVAKTNKVQFNPIVTFDINREDLSKHNKILVSWKNKQHRKINSINWFIPDFINPYGGGHYNIFRFANMFSKIGVTNRFFIYNSLYGTSIKWIYNKLGKIFPSLLFEVILRPIESVDLEKVIPYADLTFATTWQSAYDVVKFNKTEGKYYFIQDFEPLFYPAGTNSALAESTYKWGMPAITFGQWLSSLYIKNYDGDAQDFIPCADRSIFYPTIEKPRKKIKRIFFFARPISERRAFEIGITALKKIKDKHPDIKIVIAGSIGRDLSKYDIPFPYEDKGSLTLEGTGDLYRTCDIGLCFSMTNLSFLPLELMASGCICLTNSGQQTDWFLKDNFNALLSEPIPSLIAERFDEAVTNYDLRKQIFNNGLKVVSATSWELEFRRILDFIYKGQYQPPK